MQAPADPGESFAAFVLECVKSSGVFPDVDSAVFSGKAEDIKQDEDAVFLRLRPNRLLDKDGKPYEMWARLFAPGGLWVLPSEETEMMVFAPPHVGDAPGVGWCMHTAQKPPAKLGLAKAFLQLPDTVRFLIRCGSWAIKMAQNTIVGVDPDGKFQVSVANGSYVAFSPVGPSFEVVIANGDAAPNNKVLAMFKVSPDGVQIVTANVAGTQKQSVTFVDGKVTAFGTGQATFAYGQVIFGNGPVMQPLGNLAGFTSTLVFASA